MPSQLKDLQTILGGKCVMFPILENGNFKVKRNFQEGTCSKKFIKHNQILYSFAAINSRCTLIHFTNISFGENNSLYRRNLVTRRVIKLPIILYAQHSKWIDSLETSQKSRYERRSIRQAVTLGVETLVGL